MKTNNRFADYLINDNRAELYSMLDSDNTSAFLDFFYKPVTIADEDGQTMVADISSTHYKWEHGAYIEMPCSRINNPNEGIPEGIYSPADLVYSDMISDRQLYAEQFCWCLPNTLRTIGDFQIRLETQYYVYSFKLRLFGDGFVKYSHSWEMNGIITTERIYSPSD